MDYSTLKWWDRRAFAISLSGFLIVLLALLAWIEHVELPEGYVFEKQSIQGIFKCCKGNGRYAQSWVGDKQVICNVTSYFSIMSGAGNACSQALRLDGYRVEAVLVRIPSMGDDGWIVSKIAAYEGVAYQRSDAQLREDWVRSSRNEAFSIAMMVFIFSYLFQLSRLKENR